METKQFLEAAKIFSRLEIIAVKEGKFLPKSRFERYIPTVVLAIARLSLLGDRAYKLFIDDHNLIDGNFLAKAKIFSMHEFRGRKGVSYIQGTYESIARTCIAAKEFYDYLK